MPLPTLDSKLCTRTHFEQWQHVTSLGGRFIGICGYQSDRVLGGILRRNVYICAGRDFEEERMCGSERVKGGGGNIMRVCLLGCMVGSA